MIAEVAVKQRAASLQPPRRVACGEGFSFGLVRAAPGLPRDQPLTEEAHMPRTQPADPDVHQDADDAAQPKRRSYGLNRWTLLGRMTADPQVRYTESGKAV